MFRVGIMSNVADNQANLPEGTSGVENGETGKGGHEAELSRAATRMALAVASGNAEEMRLAASDHAAALGSQSTAMAASIASMLIKHMDTAIGAVVARLDRSDSASLNWRGTLREHLDNRFDAYGLELDELKDGLARLRKSELEVHELRIVQDAHTTRLDKLEQLGRDDTTAAILKLEQRLDSSELEHKALIKLYQEERTALLLRLEQRHGDQ